MHVDLALRYKDLYRFETMTRSGLGEMIVVEARIQTGRKHLLVGLTDSVTLYFPRVIAFGRENADEFG